MKLTNMLKVVIYTTRSCPYCIMEKDYLSLKGIVFKEIRVDENAEKAQEMIEKSGQVGVPFTVITKDDGSEIQILGFDRKKLELELNQVLDL